MIDVLKDAIYYLLFAISLAWMLLSSYRFCLSIKDEDASPMFDSIKWLVLSVLCAVLSIIYSCVIYSFGATIGEVLTFVIVFSILLVIEFVVVILTEGRAGHIVFFVSTISATILFISLYCLQVLTFNRIYTLQSILISIPVAIIITFVVIPMIILIINKIRFKLDPPHCVDN